MLRNLFGFAIFAVVTIFVLKVVFGLFGLVLGAAGNGTLAGVRRLHDLPGAEARCSGNGITTSRNDCGALKGESRVNKVQGLEGTLDLGRAFVQFFQYSPHE